MNRRNSSKILTEGLVLNFTNLFNKWYESLIDLENRWGDSIIQFEDLNPKSLRFITAFTKNSAHFQDRRNLYEQNIMNPPSPNCRSKEYIDDAVEYLSDILDKLEKLIKHEVIINDEIAKKLEIEASNDVGVGKKPKVTFATDVETVGDGPEAEEEAKVKEEAKAKEEARAKEEAKSKEEAKAKEETKTREEARAKEEARSKEEAKDMEKQQDKAAKKTLIDGVL